LELNKTSSEAPKPNKPKVEEKSEFDDYFAGDKSDDTQSSESSDDDDSLEDYFRQLSAD
jgi:hypothetical protein